jgi:hypothetical protein
LSNFTSDICRRTSRRRRKGRRHIRSASRAVNRGEEGEKVVVIGEGERVEEEQERAEVRIAALKVRIKQKLK